MELLLKPEILKSYICGPTFGNAESHLTLIYCTMFQHLINAESFPESQLCVNTFPTTKITLITMGFNSVA
jgi:hypothetical protein